MVEKLSVFFYITGQAASRSPQVSQPNIKSHGK